MIAARAAALAPGEWIPVIGGWHPQQLREGRGPTTAELDAVAPDHPTYVQVLYDEAVLNRAGLAAAGLDADPPGGTVDRENGIVRGFGAFRHCLAAMGRPGRAAQAHSIRAMGRELAALGLTGALGQRHSASSPRPMSRSMTYGGTG